MRHLTEQLQTALSGRYADDELRTVVRALCLEGLGLPTNTVYLKESVTLSEAQSAWLKGALRRLQEGEPLQYVLGTAPFAGLELKVDRRVLIPRPETAELVELVLHGIIGKTAKQSAPEAGGRMLLDVGTGSGCIAIALAKALPDMEVTACDVSVEALEVARLNAHEAGVDVRFVQTDVLDTNAAAAALPKGCMGIVSNPPYVRLSERAEMEARVKDWEPSLALFVPDDDPLLFYRALARLGQTAVLADGGWMAVEINTAFAQETCALFSFWGYEEVCLHSDFYGLSRFVTCRKR